MLLLQKRQLLIRIYILTHAFHALIYYYYLLNVKIIIQYTIQCFVQIFI